MNRYAIWKYLTIALALVVGGLYTLPNFFGEAPAVQISSAKPSRPLPLELPTAVEMALAKAGLSAQASSFDTKSLKVRMASNGDQLKAKDAIEKALNPNAGNPDYVVALNLVSRSPAWLTALNASPMYLGLDLRGGVHFMLQVDMQAALTKKAEALGGDLRTAFRENNIRHAGINRNAQTLEVAFNDVSALQAATRMVQDQWTDFSAQSAQQGDHWLLTLVLKPEAARRVQQQALKQNITTLHNRINELGVAEPVIQQQGLDRIVVQLPGVQDTAKAKDILGRTATLEVRMVDDSSEAKSAELSPSGVVPFGDERFAERSGQAVIVKKQVLLTGRT